MKIILALVLTAMLAVSVFAVHAAAVGTDPSSKLLAEWNFDDQNTNDSKGSNNATFMSGSEAATATYVDGAAGKALQLSATSSDNFWLSVPYAAFGDSRDSFSLSIWYNATGLSERGQSSQLLTFTNSNGAERVFWGPAVNADVNFAFTGKDPSYGYANFGGGVTYVPNTWTHLVLCVKPENDQSKIIAYVNGVEQAVDQGGDWANTLMSAMNIDTLTIGGYASFMENPHAPVFYGAVDEIGLYSGVLSAEEAAYLYDVVINPPVDQTPDETPSNPATGALSVLVFAVPAIGVAGIVASKKRH